ncbi:Caleosin-domain-containing protein [Coniochaeta ligniaria NRRL 30616]|uniref:Caleosin-domain-containing protein n=1 Tax=Coniochaeta ligniaria NRRL 30616 TaxID=1408157 RepID=A0A1J7JRR3_9PEZI|nr:Caleosin-domain-containing protein [Coniochaeta ligniaria NRRL 30616]
MNDDKPSITTAVSMAPVTAERKPFIQLDDQRVSQAGVARANLAPTYDKPEGTTEDDWAERHKHQSVLQQHLDFFDQDRDGIIYPLDTFRGFRRLGFGYLLSLLSVLIIHSNFSYPTLPSIIPDPLFRIYIQSIHTCKHGSDSGTYDTEGRFVPQKFEDIFSKYAEGKDGLTIWDLWDLHKGQRLYLDPIGWFAQIFEWLATYLMLWPEDGKMKKEDIRGVFDGSIFYTIAARREGGQRPA